MKQSEEMKESLATLQKQLVGETIAELKLSEYGAIFVILTKSGKKMEIYCNYKSCCAAEYCGATLNINGES